MYTRFLLAPCALLLSACFQQGGIEVKDDTEAPGPSIRLDPEQLDFGEIARGDVAIDSFYLGNAGDEPLTIHGIALTEGTVSFSVLNETTVFSLDPGAGVEVLVAFEPVGSGDAASAVVIDSDDPTRPTATVTLTGTTPVGVLGFDTASHDFGAVTLGCEATASVALLNDGAGPVQVETLTIAGDGFALLDAPTLPATLEPGASLTLGLGFTPDVATPFSGSLAAVTDEGEEATLSLAGTGVEPEATTETFEVADLPIDLVFSADQSGSMDDDLASMASAFATFMTQLEGMTNDWRFIVANDDDGCSVVGVLDPTSANYVGAFENGIRSGGGWYTEALFTVAATALEATDPGECNEGFLRDEALLHVVLVSDEPEQSSSGWEAMVGRIVAAKDDPTQVRISAVAGDYPSGCGSASAGTGYYEATQQTGGAFLSICASWTTTANVLARTSQWGWRFALADEPVPDSIVVRVDDVATTAGWAWDTTSGAVIFDREHAVEYGGTVTITYTPTGSCED